MAVREFRRYERKYIVTSEKAVRLLECISERLIPDRFCIDNRKYSIYNIYFDTENNDIIRRSCEKPYFKEKLRLRAYDNYNETDKAFLEIKRKIGGFVVKRRVEMSAEDAKNFIENGIKPFNQDMQKINEFAYYISLYKLVPAVFLAYDRLAYTVKDDQQVRITFDTNIRVRRDNLSFKSGAYGEVLLDEKFAVLEIKFPYTTPLWLAKELSAAEIYPHSYSKYGEAYKAELCKNLSKEPQTANESMHIDAHALALTQIGMKDSMGSHLPFS